MSSSFQPATSTSAVLADLSPQPLWHLFEQLSALPRPSKQEEAVLRWLETLADQRGLAHLRDSAGNLIIRKAACPGREQAPGIVMQCHVDMVGQKRPASQHDFTRDPLRLRLENDWLHATDTTLGADNGLGAMAMLAVMLSEDIPHGPLEALFTVDEEAGMGGAKGLQAGLLTGSLLLNLDTEEEGELYVGCAGGIDANIHKTLPSQAVPAGGTTYEIRISGLRGGHSGIDIHRGRGNAVRLMASLLLGICEWADTLAPGMADTLGVCEWHGGSLRNAIARDSVARVVIPDTHSNEFESMCQHYLTVWQQQLQAVEPGLQLALTATTPGTQLTPARCLVPMLRAMLCCPHGALRMCDDFTGVVETSNNLASVHLEQGQLTVQCLARSTLEAGRDQACETIRCAFALAGADITFGNAYPGWQPAASSPLLQQMQAIHTDLFGTPAKIQVIHAGLECGMLQAKYPHWDMISFGPTIQGAHSPDERVHIPSVQRFWDYLLAALDRLSAPASALA
ncbi:MAG: aminoacyl-histidine dipeptidase [Hahellaceae bacterium]|nr:aminoacyl-histidine dipeptidase [Hahellaceae bacterium]